MAVSPLEPATEKLLHLLSSLPPAQLATAVSQYADLSKYIAEALRVLAAATLQRLVLSSSSSDSNAKIIADLVRKLIARGDPSLAKKMLPHHSSMIDLAICTNARDLCARLLDETSAMECIQAAGMVLERVCNTVQGDLSLQDESMQRIEKAARCLACVVSSMPRRKILEEGRSRIAPRQKARDDTVLLLDRLRQISALYESITQSQAASDGQNLPVLRCKVALLDASWSLAEFLLFTGQGAQERAEEVLSALCGDGSKLRMGSMPLLDQAFMVDLVMIRPELLRLIKSNLSPAIVNSVKTIEEQANASTHKDTPFSSPLWTRVSSSFQKQVSSNDDEQIESILSILPHLASDRKQLKQRLKGPRYHGKELERIVQLLLEDEDDADGEIEGRYVEQEDHEAMQILRERANVFNDEPLQAAALTRGKARGDRMSRPFELSEGLSDEIRAAILARAEMPDTDEGEEWNPFGDYAYEAGFEEEIEPQPASTVKEAYGDEASDQEGDEEGDEGGKEEGAQSESRGQTAAGFTTSVVAEKAAERMLIGAWKERGEHFFSKEARKSSARGELKTALNNLAGKRWDDGLVESWATMFGRNPHKDRLLASVDDIMRVGNTNRIEEGEDSFGPDRGRGGRILTDGGIQRGGGRGGRGRGGSRGRGRGRGRGHK